MMEYALLNQAAEDTVRSVVTDVSLGGLQVRSREPFAPGVRLELSIGRLDAQPLEISGEVRYSTPIPDSDLFSTGVSIVSMTPGDRIRWADYVHAVFQARAEELV
jgi:hypothetical protein